MDNEANPFSAWLNMTMKSRGISQADLARAVGVADAQVSRWRRGQVVPTVRYLQQIADIMGMQRTVLDRLAGYPVDELGADAAPIDPELEELKARFADMLQNKVPRSMWNAYAAACAALADGIETSLKPAVEKQQPDKPNERGMGFRR